MGHQRSNQNNNTPANLSEDTIKSFLENQRAQLINEQQQMKLREKEIDANKELAIKSMEHQSNYLQKKPHENRKTMTRFAYIIGGLILIGIGFVSYCLYLGKDQFIMATLQKLGYVATTFMGYYFGQKERTQNKGKSEEQIDDADIVEN